MALNKETFKTRTLTAVVFVIVMLSGLLINPYTFFILFSIIHFGCWIEYQKLFAQIEPGYKNINSFHKYAVMLAGFGFMLFMSDGIFKIGDYKLSTEGWFCMIIMLVALFINELIFNKNSALKNIGISVAGLLYISLSCGLMVNLRSEGVIYGNSNFFDVGWILPVIIIATIWINDTMAYIVGSLIGKTSLSSISPKKTWEGTIGGALLAIIVVTVSAYYIFKADITQLIAVTVIATIAGIFGDLLESKLKRLANVKDSGSIMPGHGGFLDRFDSLLLATVFVWIYLKLCI